MQKIALILKKCALFKCICGLNSHLKCNFKCILEKKHHNFPCGASLLCLYMKHLLKCLYSKKPPLLRKIYGCAPVMCTGATFTFSQMSGNLPSLRDGSNMFLIGTVNDSLKVLIIFTDICHNHER